MPRVFDEEAVDVRVRRDVRRSDAVRVRERQRAGVGHIEEEAVLIRVDAQTLVDALVRDAGLEVVRRAAEREVLVIRVAEFVRVAVAEKVAEDVAAGLQRVAAREPLRHRGAVGRLEELAMAELRARLVRRVRGDRRVVLAGDVVILPLERLAVRLIGDAADAEVVFFVILVDRFQPRGGLGREVETCAAEDEGLIERMADVGRDRGVRAARPEEDDVLLVDLLDGAEEERLVARDRTADGQSDLVARVVVVLLQIERALGAERGVAEESEDASFQRVRARLRHDRQRAAGRAADLGVEAVRDRAELAHRILAESRAGESVDLVREIDAVDQDRRLRCVAARADDRPAVDEAEAAALALYSWSNECESLEVAIGDRQLLDLLRDDVRRRVGLVDVDHLLRGIDGDRLARRLLHGDRQLRGLPDQQRHLLRFERREAFEREAELVVSRLQRDEAGDAGGVGDARRLVAGLGPRQRHGDAGKGAFRLIEGDRFDGCFVDLSERGNGDEEKRKREEREQRTAVQHRSLRLPTDRSVLLDAANTRRMFAACQGEGHWFIAAQVHSGIGSWVQACDRHRCAAVNL